MDLRKRFSKKEQYLRCLELPPDYTRRANQFYAHLKSFYRRKWNANLQFPHVNGVQVNLFKLYETVKEFGGCQRVTNSDKWFDVAKEVFGMTEDISGAEYCARLIYMRYLARFEQNELVGDVDEHDSELMGSRSRNRGFSLFAPTECPVSTQRRIPDNDQQYDRLVKSLSSCLPNEVDFALNTCLIMSCPGPLTLQLQGHPSLLTLIVAHSGIFDESNEYLQDYILTTSEKTTGRDFVDFWSRVGITDTDVLKLLPLTVPIEHAVQKGNDFFSSLNGRNPLDKKIAVMECRVKQILNIIRNLSFEECNRGIVANSWPALKLLIACMGSDDCGLRNDALDSIGELAPQMNLTTDSMSTNAPVLLKLIRTFLFSDDRFLMMRSAEILGGLCMIADNETIMVDFLTTDLLERVFELVVVKDVLICVHALESLFNMTETGRSICDRLAEIPHGIELLVDFATVEAPQFGVTGLYGIKVVEYGNEAHHRQYIPQVQQIRPGPVHLSVPIQQRAMPVPISHHPMPIANIRPHVVVNSKGDFAITTAAKPVLAPQLTHRPTDMTSEQKVEHYSKLWIQQNCAYDLNSWADRGEVYASYVEHFRNAHKILSCSLQSFCKFVKDIFPQSEVKNNGQNILVFHGIRFLKKDKSREILKPAEPVVNGALKYHLAHQETKIVVAKNVATVAPVMNGNSVTVAQKQNNVESDEEEIPEEEPETIEEVTTNGIQNPTDEETKDSIITDEGINGSIMNGNSENVILDAEEYGDDLEVMEEETIEHDDTLKMMDECEDAIQNGDAVITEQTVVVESKMLVEETIEADGEETVVVEGTFVTDISETVEQKVEEKILTNGELNGIHKDGNSEEVVINEETIVTEETVITESIIVEENTEAPLVNGSAHPEPLAESPKEEDAESANEANSSTEIETKINEEVNDKISETIDRVVEQIDDSKSAIKESLVNGSLKSPKSKSKKRLNSEENNENSRPSPKKSRTKKKPTENGVSESGKPIKSVAPQTAASSSKTANLMCEWDACARLCQSGASILHHILREHLEQPDEAPTAQPSTSHTYFYCRWPGCDRTPRTRWSLITHLQDHHCSEELLNTAARKRHEMGDYAYISHIKQTLQMEAPLGKHNTGYSQYAAFDAIRRHAFTYLNRDITDEPEGPVTKSLRLTSSLILRNLARHSFEGRRRIRRFEGLLSSIAMSRLESSTALSQCLAALGTNDRLH